jgi:hypothetical protein
MAIDGKILISGAGIAGLTLVIPLVFKALGAKSVLEGYS